MQIIWEKEKGGVQASISTKEQGDLSFKWGSEAGAVIENRRQWFSRLNLDLNKLIAVDQPHGNNVTKVSEAQCGRGVYQKDWLEGVDALITSDTGIILGIETADCLPIFLKDSKKNVIGLAHAGWRGVVANIASNFVEVALAAGARIDNIEIAIGPHIQKCCFVVKEEIIKEFKGSGVINNVGDQCHVDLQLIVRNQLMEVGIKSENISVNSECTCCLKNKYYSYRRDKEKCVGSMLSIITQ